MSQHAELKQACQEFQASLDKLQTGAVVEDEKKISTEQEILLLKEMSEFINSKVKTIKVSNPPVEHRDYKNVDIVQEEEELINNVINSEQADKSLNSIIMDHTLQSVLQNTSDESGVEIYTNKILEQLQRLKNSSEQLIQSYEIQNEVRNQISKTLMYKNKIIEEKLKERTVQYNAECDKNFTQAYKEKMELIKSRIEKINFMRLLIPRLVMYSKANVKQNPHLLEIIITDNKPVSLDSLLK